MTKKKKTKSIKRRIIYRDYFPYHVSGKCLDKNWFGISKAEIWEIFVDFLNRQNSIYKTKCHAFVMMSNHYHLIISANENMDLKFLVERLQNQVSLEANLSMGVVQSIFEYSFHMSEITTPTYYRRVLKYVYRNPVEAGVCNRVEDYRFSSLNSDDVKMVFPYNIDSYVNYKEKLMLAWLNEDLEEPYWETFRQLSEKRVKLPYPGPF